MVDAEMTNDPIMELFDDVWGKVPQVYRQINRDRANSTDDSTPATSSNSTKGKKQKKKDKKEKVNAKP